MNEQTAQFMSAQAKLDNNETVDYAPQILAAQALISEQVLCNLFQDKQFIQMLDNFQTATIHIRNAAIQIAAMALKNARNTSESKDSRSEL